MSARRLHRVLLLPWLAVALVACGQRPAPPDPATSTPAVAQVSVDAALNEWLDARFEESLDFSPLSKTSLGRKDDYDKIDDLSEAAQEAQLAWLRASVEEMRRTFAYDRLTPEGKTSYDL
ncbi:MAG TPA: DUF885 domain-containing protein, partial [Gammaproteobacteria bacterium]|nr:DUF885 domain-containing protein [Gammaproteobacteria bacterium]